MNTTKKAWINAIFLIVTLAINTLGAIGLINGLTQKEISDRYVTAITPSPSTFSIWSVIYSLLIISIIVLIVKKKDPYYERALDQLELEMKGGGTLRSIVVPGRLIVRGSTAPLTPPPGRASFCGTATPPPSRPPG